MSLCNVCSQPGACCKNMLITLREQDEPYKHTSLEYANTWFEFFPQVATRINEDGHVVFDCPLLDECGRCSDYENRPKMCAENFPPGLNELCVFYGKIHENEDVEFLGAGIA